MHCSAVSIVDFEQINAYLDTFLQFYSGDNTFLDHLAGVFIDKFLEIKRFVFHYTKNFPGAILSAFFSIFSAQHAKTSAKEMNKHLKHN